MFWALGFHRGRGMSGKDKKAASIGDVARRAGVSISTISRAMSDKDRLNPQTYERVQRAIRELNYKKARRGPSSARPRTVAVVVPSILDPYFSVALHGIDNVARTYNFNTLLFDSCNSAEIEAKDVARILESSVDGVVLVPAGSSREGYGMLRDAGNTLCPSGPDAGGRGGEVRHLQRRGGGLPRGQVPHRPRARRRSCTSEATPIPAPSRRGSRVRAGPCGGGEPISGSRPSSSAPSIRSAATTP